MLSKSAEEGQGALTSADGPAGRTVQQSGEHWAPIRGWGNSYIIDAGSGRVRSRDREVVDTLGRVRRLKGVELAPTVSRGCVRVTLCTRGHKRTIDIAHLLRAAGVARGDA